jgi:hypothetical protein
MARRNLHRSDRDPCLALQAIINSLTMGKGFPDGEDDINSSHRISGGRGPPKPGWFLQINLRGGCHPLCNLRRRAFQSSNFAARGMSRDCGKSTSTSAMPCGRPISSIRPPRGGTSCLISSRRTLRRLRAILRAAFICIWKSGSSGGPSVLLMKLRRGRTSRLISSRRVKRRCVGRSLLISPLYRVRRLPSSRLVVLKPRRSVSGFSADDHQKTVDDMVLICVKKVLD